MARLPRDCGALAEEVRGELESVMEKTGYLDQAPFSWVTVALRFGLKDDVKPKFSRISSKHGDLPLAIELDVSVLQGESASAYRAAYRRAAARALLAAAIRYHLSAEAVLALSGIAELQMLGQRGDA